MQIWELVSQVYRDLKGGKSEKGVADIFNQHIGHIYKYAEPNGRDISLSKAITLSIYSKNPVLIKHFADQCGYGTYEMPNYKRRNLADYLKDLSKAIKEFSEFTESVSASLIDGKII